MSTPQWNADIITPDDGSVDIAVNGGLVENEQGELGVSVDGESIVINSDGELEANIPTPETVDQVFDGTSTHAQSGVAMAGALADYTPTASLASVATSGAYSDLSGTPDLSLKEDAANKKQSIDGTSETDFPSSKAVAQYVGDAITTNSAAYISDNGQPFSSANDLPTDPTVVSNNDYAIVLSQGIYYRYKATVSGSTVTWALEYEINTSPLSQAQLNAVNSGITAAKVTAYDGHVADTDIHVTTSDKSAWNAKQDTISDLDTIRSGASAGATAVQPGDLATVATTGAYSDLSGTPTIPSLNVFVATYGTTTYQELSAAKAADKAIFLTGVSGALSAVMPMTSFSTNPAMVMFSTVVGDIEYQAKIDQGVWSSTSVSLQADWNESNQLAPSYIANKPANLVQDASYVHTDNNFTTSLKDKLDGIASGAEVNVQADWNESNSSSDAYIQNKPSIPTIGTIDLTPVSPTPTPSYYTVQCPTCFGEGTYVPEDASEPETCWQCGGAGVVCSSCLGSGIMAGYHTCEECGGTGYVDDGNGNSVECGSCFGVGGFPTEETCGACGGEGHPSV